jgi:hypothetical protein
MKIEAGTHCPLLNKKCITNKCMWFSKIQGTDKNTGEHVEDWQCAVSLLPMLLVENSGQQRQTGAAVESFRNEMVKANENSQKILIATSQQNLLEGKK